MNILKLICFVAYIICFLAAGRFKGKKDIYEEIWYMGLAIAFVVMGFGIGGC